MTPDALALAVVRAARAEVCQAATFDQRSFGRLLRVEQYLTGTVVHPAKFLPQSLGCDSEEEATA